MTPELVFIGIGANEGRRRETCQKAARELAGSDGISALSLSPWYETEPWGEKEQRSFINGVARFQCALTPYDLFELLMRIEAAHGRCRERETHWGPRPLDLDILLFGEQIVDDPRLTIPHREMHRRRFVLEPLASLAPLSRHPKLNKTIKELLAKVSDDGAIQCLQSAILSCSQHQPRREPERKINS